MTTPTITTPQFTESAAPIPNPDWAHLRYTRYATGNVIKFKPVMQKAARHAVALAVIDSRVLSLRNSIETMQFALRRMIDEAEFLQSAEFRRNWPQVYAYEKKLRDLNIAP